MVVPVAGACVGVRVVVVAVAVLRGLVVSGSRRGHLQRWSSAVGEPRAIPHHPAASRIRDPCIPQPAARVLRDNALRAVQR